MEVLDAAILNVEFWEQQAQLSPDLICALGMATVVQMLEPDVVRSSGMWSIKLGHVSESGWRLTSSEYCSLFCIILFNSIPAKPLANTKVQP